MCSSHIAADNCQTDRNQDYLRPINNCQTNRNQDYLSGSSIKCAVGISPLKDLNERPQLETWYFYVSDKDAEAALLARLSYSSLEDLQEVLNIISNRVPLSDTIRLALAFCVLVRKDFLLGSLSSR